MTGDFIDKEDNDKEFVESDINRINDVINEVMSKPLSKDELSGFKRKRPDLPSIHPYVRIDFPELETEHKGYEVEVGVKGTF